MDTENLNSLVITNPTDDINDSYKKTYGLIQRKKIAERVENLKSKKHFKYIFKLIHNSCPNSYTKDGYGVYINFEVLHNNTMEQIETYLDEVSPKTSLIPLPTKYTPYFSDDYTPKDSGIKLSNHEKNILKYIGNDNDVLNTFDTESSAKIASETATKTKIIIKPFTFD
jgi:hypothetical protein